MVTFRVGAGGVESATSDVNFGVIWRKQDGKPPLSEDENF